jgi:hypothetical protein
MYPSDTVLARGPEFKPQYCKKKKKKKSAFWRLIRVGMYCTG